MELFTLSRRRFVTAATMTTAFTARQLAAQNVQQVTRMGIVRHVLGQTIFTISNNLNLPIELAKDGVVWKGQWRQDIAAIGPGDTIVAKGYLTYDKLTATKLWCNVASFFGTITSANGSNYSVLTSRLQQRFAFVDGDTLSGNLMPFQSSDIQVGRTAQTIGLAMSDGTVHATRVVVYVDGRPTTMPSDSFIINPRTGVPFRSNPGQSIF